MDNKELPAFPVETCFGTDDHQSHSGLTKRELMAALAMQGVLANPHTHEELGPQQITDKALEVADILLAKLSIT